MTKTTLLLKENDRDSICRSLIVYEMCLSNQLRTGRWCNWNILNVMSQYSPWDSAWIYEHSVRNLRTRSQFLWWWCVGRRQPGAVLRRGYCVRLVVESRIVSCSTPPQFTPFGVLDLNPLNPELNPICYLLALLGAHNFLHVSRIRVNFVFHHRSVFPVGQHC